MFPAREQVLNGYDRVSKQVGGAVSSFRQSLAAAAAQTASLLTPKEISQARADLDDAPSAAADKPAVSNRSIMEEWRFAARRTLIPVALFSVFVNLLMLTIPVYLFQLSDRVLTSRSMDTLVMLTIIALVFIGVLALLDIVRRQVLARLATRFQTILGGPLLASVVSTARASDSANLRALRSLHQVKSFISSPVMLLLFDAPLAPIYFAAVFLIHPDLGFAALAAGLLLIGVAVLNQRATAKQLAQASLHAANADADAESLARNSQVINAMGMLNESILHWGREQSRSLNVQADALEANVWLTGLAKFARLITQIAILGVGAYLALQGNLTGGMMIAAAVIAGRALLPLEGMIEGWRNVAQARAAYAQVGAAIESLGEEEQHLLLPKPAGKLTLDRILYLPAGSKEPVLNGVSFELEPGDSLAIVGPSGSGKSTLARIIVGCLLPTAGKVRLDGTELRNWDRRQFGVSIGYLPQEVELFPGTIRENICRMRDDLPDQAVYAAATFSGVHQIIAHLPAGYETVLDRNGGPLSGGQRQRIALARAFFGEPCVIVLDEPNSNLDAAGEQALAETLRRAKEKRITVVVITQRPALLNSMDKLLVLRAGRVEALGPPAEVLRRLMRSSNVVAAPNGGGEAAQAEPASSSARAGNGASNTDRGNGRKRRKEDERSIA